MGNIKTASKIQFDIKKFLLVRLDCVMGGLLQIEMA
jgi:hypothetical protein